MRAGALTAVVCFWWTNLSSWPWSLSTTIKKESNCDAGDLPSSDGSAEATGFWRSDEDFMIYYRSGDHREIWDIKFGAEDEVLLRLRDGVGVLLQERFTGTRQ